MEYSPYQRSAKYPSPYVLDFQSIARTQEPDITDLVRIISSTVLLPWHRIIKAMKSSASMCKDRHTGALDQSINQWENTFEQRVPGS